MIWVERISKPEYLSGSKIKAIKDNLASEAGDAKQQKRLRFDMAALVPVRKPLLEMFQHKCAYCETSLKAGGSGEIDHFRPKSGARGFESDTYADKHYWWLAYEWENLVIACQTCSQKFKRDYFPLENERDRANIGETGEELLKEKALLIDPSTDVPAKHLNFNEDGTVNGLTRKGEVTIDVLGLSRTQLNAERKKKISELSVFLKEALLRRELRSEFVTLLNSLYDKHTKVEYAGALRDTFFKWVQRNNSVWKRLVANQQELMAKIKEEQDWRKKGASGRNIKQKVKPVSPEFRRFSIKRIEIKNFKSIEYMKIETRMLQENDNKESWLLLLGDNGIGKSTILQAIGMTLMGKEQLDKLNLDAKDFLKWGADLGHVEITSYESETPVRLDLNKTNFTASITKPLTFIIGYGSTRLPPKGNLQPDNDKLPFCNVRNLFDYSVSLNDSESWLASLTTEEFEARIAKALYDLLNLKTGRLSFKDGTLYINESHLESVSDGYKSVVAMACDMMETLSIDAANYHSTQGIVLIDELGNHLHPRWKLRIVESLKNTFPNLQFIVTSHEPLCLRGLKYGEVSVILEDENKRVLLLDRDDLPDHTMLRTDQLLTSDLFGLISTIDPGTEKIYTEYFELVRLKEEGKLDATQQERLDDLRDSLLNKEVRGETAAEQVFYKKIKETEMEVREKGLLLEKDIAEETMKQVNQLIQQNKIDWL